jgi:putative ABC transport system permease protein
MAPIVDALAFSLPIALCCLSICVSFRMLRFPDLGLTGAFIIGTYSYAVALLHRDSIPWAVGAMIIAGAAAGALTGYLHYGLRLNSLLAGITTYYVFRSLAARLALNFNPHGGFSPVVDFESQRGVGRLLTNFMPWTDRVLSGRGLPYPHAILSALLMVVASAGLAWFARTRLGIVLRAFGDNREAAIEGNFPVLKLGVVGLMISSVLAATGGAALMFTNAHASIDSGNSILLESFAAFFLGDSLARSVSRSVVYRYTGRQIVVTALCGTAIYSFLRNVTQVLATRVSWLEATDYGFGFAVMLVLVGVMSNRDEGKLPRPVPIY